MRFSKLNSGLEGCKVTTPGARALARSGLLDQLVSLDLSSNEIDNGAVRALAESPRAAGLRRLVLRFCRFADRGMQDLASSPHLSGLASLSVYGSTQRW